MAWNPRLWMRKLHRWGAVLVALPFLVIIITGLMLQLKKDWHWVQPPTIKTKSKEPTISFEQILTAVRDVPETEVKSWEDIDRVDVRPSHGNIKVTCKNRWEVQLDAATGKVLQIAYRRSDLIESLHDGTWFSDSAKLWIFLPTAFVVLGLWITGIYLFVLPWWVKWRRQKPGSVQSAK
jgi:uncharacterized iron-regulated membrane protein